MTLIARVVVRPRLFKLLVAIVLIAGSANRASAGQPPGFVYALRDGSGGANQIYGFRFNSVTGALTLLPGFPVATGGLGTGITAAEMMAYGNGRLYVLNDSSDTMSAFAVNQTTGALTALPFSPVALGSGTWAAVAVHPTGSPVVVGDASASHRIASFVVTATTASAAPGSPFDTGVSSPYSVEFSRDGNYVYAGGNLFNTIAGFSVAQATGVLTALAGSPFDSGGGSPTAYATDDAGRLFSASLTISQVRVFTTAAGVPTGVSGNPFASGLSEGAHGVLHPGGFYFVADRNNNRVGAYRIAGTGAATTLSVVSGSPFAEGGNFPDALALSPDGRFLIVANGFSHNLTTFHVDATTGSLSSLLVQPVNTLGATGVISGLAFAPGPVPGDFDDDAKADITVYRPSSGTWFSLQSSTSYATYLSPSWGLNTDFPVAADYDGDGRTDVAIYRPSTGTWYILQSSSNFTTFASYPWGLSTDIPVPADYDGDGKTDPAIYRPSTGTWYILQSSTGYTASVSYAWGVGSDTPVPGDYDGDGKADVAIYRPSSGSWYVLQSSTGYTASVSYVWGVGTDVAVPGDYDGDGRTDVAIYRPSAGIWYILQSSTGYTSYVWYTWGVSTDTAVPTDYDGDGRADLAVFRPSTGTWYVLQSGTNFTTSTSRSWGLSTDIPIPRRP